MPRMSELAVVQRICQFPHTSYVPSVKGLTYPFRIATAFD